MCAHRFILASWIVVMSECFFKNKKNTIGYFAEIHFDDTCKLPCKQPCLSPVALFLDKSLSVWRKAHQKQEMIKWTISGVHQVPLLWGPQIRPSALPLENRHRTQRKLLSAALPHLPGLSRSNF